MARNKHPGVGLVPPDLKSRTGWRVRYVDVDSGKRIRRTLDPSLTTKARREDYAIKLSERLNKRRQELKDGAVRATGTTLGGAEALFFASLIKKRPKTIAAYKEGTSKFMTWAAANRIQTCDTLTRGQVIKFRVHLLSEDVSPHTFNKWLRGCKRMWKFWILSDLCPKLNLQDLQHIEQEEAPTELREFLTPSKVRQLLESCQRHDAQTFSMTRREKVGEAAKGETPRYQPISGFVLFVLLSGVRLSEALRLDWKDVNLKARNHAGDAVGEFRIRATESKTKKPRVVKLGVSPVMRRLLIAQRLKSGGRGPVWNMTEDGAIKAMRRLRVTFGAPEGFSYQCLRRTASTFLVNSSIFGSASAYMAAKMLGHGVSVMERNYSGLVDGIDPTLRDLESVLGIEDLADRIVRQISEGAPSVPTIRGVAKI